MQFCSSLQLRNPPPPPFSNNKAFSFSRLLSFEVMSPTKVIVIGAGIAGPLLAVFLKHKGYDPVLYERTEKVSTAGLSLW